MFLLAVPQSVLRIPQCVHASALGKWSFKPTFVSDGSPGWHVEVR